MRKSFGAKAWTYPQPVYIIGTYDKNGVPNAMNAAWGGISNSTEISFCLSSNHKTIKNLKEIGEFTVSIATEEYLKACDYVGIVSGNKEPNKFEKAGFHHTQAEKINAPIIEELPMSLECKMISYDEKTETLRGMIINVSADESILTDSKIDVKKLNPIIFDPIHTEYWSMGEKVGNAFSDGKEIIKGGDLNEK